MAITFKCFLLFIGFNFCLVNSIFSQPQPHISHQQTKFYKVNKDKNDSEDETFSGRSMIFDLDYGFAQPMGSFGASTPVRSSGFASLGHQFTFQAGFYPNLKISHFHIGFLSGFRYSHLPMDGQAFRRILTEEYQLNDPLTQFRSEFDYWMITNLFLGLSLGFDYGPLLIEPFITFGVANAIPPVYRITNGNFIPANYGKFFADYTFEQPNVHLCITYGAQARLIFSPHWGLTLNAAIQQMTQPYRTQIFTVSYNNNNVPNITRNTENYTQNIQILSFTAGIFYKFLEKH